MAVKVEKINQPNIATLSSPSAPAIAPEVEVVSKRRSFSPARTTAFILLILLNLTVPETIEAADSEASIKVTRFQVPQVARIGDSVRLICLYELHGETLHAMKLFKDDKEFYRYTPSMRREEQRLPFALGGIKVDMAQSTDRSVVIRLLDKRSAGLFKCQVSVEGTFRSISAERRMDVIDRLAPSMSNNGGAANTNNNHNRQQQQRHTMGTNGNQVEQASTFMLVRSGAVQVRDALSLAVSLPVFWGIVQLVLQ